MKRFIFFTRIHLKNFILFGVIVSLLLLTSCTTPSKMTSDSSQTAHQDSSLRNEDNEKHAKRFNLEAVTVERVVDGDTFKLTDGRRVRLIGINTPESTKRMEEYGKEASQYTTSKLTGKQIWIQKDISETDRYDRLLRIVWLSIPTNDMDESEIRGKMLNADLVLNGYAEPSTFPPDVKYSDYFIKFAREARDHTDWVMGIRKKWNDKGRS